MAESKGLPSDVRFMVDSFYTAQRQRIRIGNRVSALLKAGLSEVDLVEITRLLPVKLRPLTDLVGIKEFFVGKNGVPVSLGRLRNMERQIENQYVWLQDEYDKIETTLEKRISAGVEAYPIWTEWLSKIRGVGKLTGGCLIAWIEGPHYPNGRFRCHVCLEKFSLKDHAAGHAEKVHDDVREMDSVDGIAAFATISKLWSYAGLGVVFRCNDHPAAAAARDGDVFSCTQCHKELKGQAQKRRRGEQSNWHTGLHNLSWKIADLFIKLGSGYRTIYDDKKAEYIRRDGMTKGHAHLMAMRKMMKIFFAHYWLESRGLAGLPVTRPYAFDRLDHTSEIGSREFMDKE